ncbi:Tubulin-specific chaperone E [Geodia barretti]|uniref:Tubulin-specific chaperone E n=2 Tax=Geodia barretti TaxID=519541 RepID=A0AA35W7E4_GEOBA|nr:Tubulin-specific chaperone E [Geodia barretti]
MESADAAEGFVVGARCCFDGYYATIRFVGEVPPAKGVWVGVEWDDASRGKHSGDHEGTQYFTCSKPGSGSFVRPRKVTLGYSFIEALRKRYAETSAETTERGGGGGGGGGKGEEDMFVISRNSLVTPVEMVGADMIKKKTSQLTKLGSVSTSLRGMLVSSVGPPGEISTVAPNIQELDMSTNHLLSSWETLAGICSQLTHLHSLNLSENFALSVPGDPRTLTPAFRQVKELTMNKMQLSWSQVCVVVSMFPGLERFHCCENLISEISSQPPLQSLRLITLEENQLSSWDSVFHLAPLPSLEILILNDNQIPQIFSPETDGRSPGFLELKSLSICRNRLHDWSSIIALDSMPALRELKIKGNPLFEGNCVTRGVRLT